MCHGGGRRTAAERRRRGPRDDDKTAREREHQPGGTGQHMLDVLRDHGYSDEQTDALAAEGAIEAPRAMA